MTECKSVKLFRIHSWKNKLESKAMLGKKTVEAQVWGGCSLEHPERSSRSWNKCNASARASVDGSI